MSDSRLRELERRYHETGSVEDEASYLVEKLRSGETTEEHLQLTAYCGHEASRSVLEAKAPPLQEDAESWAAGVAWWGRKVAVFATIVAAQQLLELADQNGEELGSDLEEAVTRAKAWLSTGESSPSPADIDAAAYFEGAGGDVAQEAALAADACQRIVSCEDYEVSGFAIAAVEALIRAGGKLQTLREGVCQIDPAPPVDVARRYLLLGTFGRGPVELLAYLGVGAAQEIADELDTTLKRIEQWRSSLPAETSSLEERVQALAHWRTRDCLVAALAAASLLMQEDPCNATELAQRYLLGTEKARGGIQERLSRRLTGSDEGERVQRLLLSCLRHSERGDRYSRWVAVGAARIAVEVANRGVGSVAVFQTIREALRLSLSTPPGRLDAVGFDPEFRDRVPLSSTGSVSDQRVVARSPQAGPQPNQSQGAVIRRGPPNSSAP